MRPSLLALAAGLALATAFPANAAWHVAKSKHFVIYADDRPKRLSEFATRLGKGWGQPKVSKIERGKQLPTSGH